MFCTFYTAMKLLTCKHGQLMIAVMVVVALLLPVDAFAETERDPPSAETAIAGALVNVKSRYRAELDHYGLTESYFDETSGICDLMLLDVQSWTKYQIVYRAGEGLVRRAKLG